MIGLYLKTITTFYFMQKMHKSQYAIIELDMINTVRKMYQRIRDLREDRDLSQAALAKLLNVSQSTYSRYESGYLDIPSNILIALARFYQVSVDYILGLTD